jgi:hypothetical protein
MVKITMSIDKVEYDVMKAQKKALRMTWLEACKKGLELESNKLGWTNAQGEKFEKVN